MPVTTDGQRVNVSEGIVEPAVRVATPPIARPLYPKRVMVSGTVALIGMVMTIVGGLMILARVQFAAAFLGARFFLGVPLTNVDAGKVVFIGIAGFAVIAVGVLTIVGSVAAIVVSPGKRT